MHNVKHWQRISIFIVIFDALTILFSYGMALWIRYDGSFENIPVTYLIRYVSSIPLYIVLCIFVYWLFKLYNILWRFASYSELLKITLSIFICLGINIVLMNFYFGPMQISYYLFGIVLQYVFCVGIRFSYRFLLLFRTNNDTKSASKRVLLIGAGAAGQAILRDIKGLSDLSEEVVCIIDDNPNKWRRYIDGIEIVGGRDVICSSCIRYRVDKIYFAIPSASIQDKKEILNICKETQCEIKQLPGMYEFIKDQATVASMKDVAIEDLLGREQIKVNLNEIFEQIQGKVILVTGGGGSIGSELCRQIAAHDPLQLIIFDIYENNAYEIQMELNRKHPNLNLEVIIGSVRDSRKILNVFETYRPQIVYHAAAHKHVPLMEDSPCEAIKNNAIGTYKTAISAMKYGCEKFVLISTDKAVNPTNIMGASKRLCEMVIQSLDHKVKMKEWKEIPILFTHDETNDIREKIVLENVHTEFVAVRFGNVLGSNGSVIPLFKKQILEGGPVTVTHKDIIRYFMTIPEAVSLVLQAGTYAHGGEIFVLDMGEPVKIDTLARNLIKLSGHRPDEEIKIVYTGLRPGEKLYEEKLMAEEGLEKTENDLIHIGKPIPFDVDTFLYALNDLMYCAYNNSPDIKEMVKNIVGTYKPKEG